MIDEFLVNIKLLFQIKSKMQRQQPYKYRPEVILPSDSEEEEGEEEDGEEEEVGERKV